MCLGPWGVICVPSLGYKSPRPSVYSPPTSLAPGWTGKVACGTFPRGIPVCYPWPPPPHLVWPWGGGCWGFQGVSPWAFTPPPPVPPSRPPPLHISGVGSGGGLWLAHGSQLLAPHHCPPSAPCAVPPHHSPPLVCPLDQRSHTHASLTPPPWAAQAGGVMGDI